MALAIGFPKRPQLCLSEGMSHVADVIRKAGLLEQQFKALGAQGRGLRERALDLDIRYPQDIFDDLIYVSSWRNAVAHCEVDDLPTEGSGNLSVNGKEDRLGSLNFRLPVASVGDNFTFSRSWRAKSLD